MTGRAQGAEAPVQRHARIEHWDDERAIGNSLIVTLRAGWQFSEDPGNGCHIEGFDRVHDAIKSVRRSIPCACADCLKLIAEQESKS